MSPAIIPCWRMRAMISYISGCIIGSPPEIVITEDPNSANLSMRCSITSIGTGSLVLSYSLQYVQARLHRRMGTMCTSTGWRVEANALTVCRTPRVNLLKLLALGILCKQMIIGSAPDLFKLLRPRRDDLRGPYRSIKSHLRLYFLCVFRVIECKDIRLYGDILSDFLEQDSSRIVVFLQDPGLARCTVFIDP